MENLTIWQYSSYRRQNNVPTKDVHVLTSRTSEYVMLHIEGAVVKGAGGIQVTILCYILTSANIKTKGLSWKAQCNHRRSLNVKEGDRRFRVRITDLTAEARLEWFYVMTQPTAANFEDRKGPWASKEPDSPLECSEGLLSCRYFDLSLVISISDFWLPKP